MKKITSTLFVTLLTLSSFAQLKNGQVYDFEVGDVFQIVSASSSGFNSLPPQTLTKTILGKTSSINGDTLIYNVKKDTYSPPACQNCQPQYGSSTAIEKYYDLDSLARMILTTTDTCRTITPKLFIDYCSRYVWQVEDSAGLCFERNINIYTYIEKCGMIYQHLDDFGLGGSQITQTLAYYKKGNDSCGTFIITGVDNKLNSQVEVNLFPNPTTNYINIKSTKSFQWFSVFDLNGKLFADGKPENNQVPVTELVKGNYLLNLYTKENQLYSTSFIKE